MSEHSVAAAEHAAVAEHAAAAEHAGLAHHFDDLQQQRESAELGMWLFLITEFMFFGGLFVAYLAYRHKHYDDFVAGSHTMDVLLGTVNTAVLLTSSLTMALAVQAAEHTRRSRLIGLLLATAVLGSVFLGVKAYEYHHKFEEGLIPFLKNASPSLTDGEQTFLNLYFLMTGLHAFHMVIGLAILLILAVAAGRGGLVGPRSIVVFNTGLYWHFVDLVWVYLFPFFYLVAARGSSLHH